MTTSNNPTRQSKRVGKVNGSKVRPRLTSKQRLVQDNLHLKERVASLESQMSRLMMQVGKDLSILQDRGMTVWEMFWGSVTVLEDKGLLTAEQLDSGRKRVLAQWAEESLREAKDKLAPGGALCTHCHYEYKAAEIESIDDEHKCPKCESAGSVFIKQSLVDPSHGRVEELKADDSAPTATDSEGLPAVDEAIKDGLLQEVELGAPDDA